MKFKSYQFQQVFTWFWLLSNDRSHLAQAL